LVFKHPAIILFEHHTDHSLILLWQQGQEAAFDALYDRYVIGILKLAIRKTGSEENARELVQDCFLSIYLAKEKLHLVEDFKAYIHKIIRNKIISYYRHELVLRKHQQMLLSGGGSDGMNQLRDSIENKELKRLIFDKIEKMPPRCREVFRLSRDERLTQKAIASRLNISENTVEQHIRKALRILRTVVDDYNKYSGVTPGMLFFILLWFR
jgi:RNA polymerase sigma-70 factor (ECF subfamily)